VSLDSRYLTAGPDAAWEHYYARACWNVSGSEKSTIFQTELLRAYAGRSRVSGVEPPAGAIAEVVGELERLTSERDSWRLRAERAEQIVKASCSPEE